MSKAFIAQSAPLESLILHVYPWWEMQRVRELGFITQKDQPLLCNDWRHTPLLLIDHTYRGVTTPNCDTMYSGAWLDLAHGPVLIEVPKTDLPYWSIAVMDLNTDNIAVMGSRYPGTQSLLVCGQDFQGEVPAHIPHIRSKSQVVWLLARYLVGTDDLVKTCEALRRAVTLKKWPTNGANAVLARSPLRTKLLPATRKSPQNFWDIIRTTFNEDPALFNNMAQEFSLNPALGWPESAKSWQDLSADLQDQFSAAYLKTLAAITANNSGNIQNRGQWRYPGPDIGRFGANAMYRAEVSLWGLGALEAKEVLYVSAFTDSEGDLLEGTNSYRFRIPPQGIPAEAFWSLTVYEVDSNGGMYFTANPLKRYAVGDRTPGLMKNPDGSIDIWISHKQPNELAKLANWLPASVGEFRLMIRAYAPSAPLRSGEAPLPAVERWPAIQLAK